VVAETLVNTKVVVKLVNELVSKFGSIWLSSLGVIAVLSNSPELTALCLERTDSGTLEFRLGKLWN
jgi:hypothetical protein